MVRCNIERNKEPVKKFKDIKAGDFFVLAYKNLYLKIDNGNVNNAIIFDEDSTRFTSIGANVPCIIPDDVDIKVVL